MKISIPHKWRKFNKDFRLNLPITIFGLDPQEIARIRKISCPRKRLIESARLQYESFNDIHNDLTAWIAGYPAEVIIRQEFGSAKKLRENVVKIPSNLVNWQDIKREIHIPNNMNKNLAEETGIHIGDGNLFKRYYSSNKGLSYRCTISGHLIDDYIYHTIHIRDLWKKIYNNPGYLNITKNKNSISNIINSRAIVEFKNKSLSLPLGNKKLIKIPQGIEKDDAFFKNCLVGILDTDGTLTKFMQLKLSLHTPFLINQIAEKLTKLKLKNNLIKKDQYPQIIIHKNSTLEILESFGLNNDKHKSKYLIWKEFKCYIPFTTTPERLSVLKGDIDIDDLKRISERRKKNIAPEKISEA